MSSTVDLSAAVEAAARANYERHYHSGRTWESLDDVWLASAREIVRPIVAAAAGLIEAQVRAQVAAALEFKREQVVTPTIRLTFTAAARIARGESA